MRRRSRAESHADILGLVSDRENESLALKQQLLRRVSSTHRVQTEVNASGKCAKDAGKHGETDEFMESGIIDTIDKLMAYTLHVIDTQSVVEPQNIKIKEIKTLEDAVFAPRRKPLEIVYLQFNPHPPCHFRNVYWLSRARSDMDFHEDFFTITSHGITRVLGHESELFDLESWLREKAIFDQIVQMKCIQQMRKMTAFQSWKHNTIGLRIAHAKKTIASSLLNCHPIAGPFLHTLRPMIVQIESNVACDIVDKSQPQFIQQLLQTQLPSEERVASIVSITSAISDLLYDTLHKLLFTQTTTQPVRYGRTLTNSEVIPALIRIVDLMVTGAHFCGAMRAIEQLNLSITGSYESALESHTTVGTNTISTNKRRNRYCRLDQLGEMPTEHIGNVEYRRLFHLNREYLPNALFYVKMAVTDDMVEAKPSEDESLRALFEVISGFIAKVDTFERILDQPRIRQFVKDHCRPYYRHCFGLSLLASSSFILNHPVVEKIMRELRSAMDIYFVEIEELASASRFVQTESQKLQNLLSKQLVATEPTEDTPLNVLDDRLKSLLQHLEIALKFHADLKLVDNLLQIGPFLVDRTEFIEATIQTCTEISYELFVLLPVRCNQYYQRAIAECAQDTRVLSSIPDSLDEAMVWIECFVQNTRHDYSIDANNTSANPACLLEQHLNVCHTTCQRISYEMRCQLISSIEAFNVKWKAHVKLLEECVCRVQANIAFYMDLIFRTMNTRRETLKNEFILVMKKLEVGSQSLAPMQDNVNMGIYGRAKDFPDLAAEIKLLLRTESNIRRLRGILETYSKNQKQHPDDFNRVDSPRDGVVLTPNQCNFLYAVLTLTDSIQRYHELRDCVSQQPLISINIPQLLNSLKMIARHCQPLSRSLGMDYPLLQRFQYHYDSFEKTIRMAQVMLLECFSDEQWAQLDENKCTCTLESLERKLVNVETQVMLVKLTSDCSIEFKLNQTWKEVDSILQRLSLKFVQCHHIMIMANELDIIAELENAQLTLLSVQTAHSQWLERAQALQNTLQKALDILKQIHIVQQYWKAKGVVVNLHDTHNFFSKEYNDLCRQLKSFNGIWRDCIMALFHSVEVQRDGNTIEKLLRAFNGFQFQSYISLCERLTVAMKSFLTKVRVEFPRFYFLQDATVWNLLTSTPSAQTCENAIIQCFDGIQTVRLVDATEVDCSVTKDFVHNMLVGSAEAAVESMTYTNGWELKLPRPFRVLGGLVYWLSRLEVDMVHALKATAATANSMIVYDAVATLAYVQEWLGRFPLQMVLMNLHYRFSSLVTDVLTPKGTILTAKLLLSTTQAMHKTLFLKLIALLRNPRTWRLIKEMESVALLLKYQDDTLVRLTSLSSTHGWEQIVFAYEGTFRFVLSQDAVMLGAVGYLKVATDVHVHTNAPLVIVTPDTERCMYSLFHVLRLNLCIMPFGPLGTGKRSLILGLSSLLMRYTVYENCSSGLPYDYFGNILKGLTALQGWGCLSSLCQLEHGHLSVMLAEITKLQQHRFLNATHEVWREDDAGMSLFLLSHSLSPPRELTKWFGSPLRPLSIPMPDRALLMQSLLYMKGFNEPMHEAVEGFFLALIAAEPRVERLLTIALLKRIACVASDIVKSVSYIIHPKNQTASHITHELSPLNIVRYKDSNVLRFALFLVLEPFKIVDILGALDYFFPSTMEMAQEYRMFESAIQVILDKAKLIATPEFIQKAIALYNYFQSVSPTILFGPAGYGKSTCLKACLQAQQLMRWTMYPRFDPSPHLERRIDLICLSFQELNDVLLHTFYQVHTQNNALIHTFCSKPAQDEKEVIECVVLDGPLPLKAGAVECLISILDNNDRLYIPGLFSHRTTKSFQHIALETLALQNASPSVVTRCNLLSFDNPYPFQWSILLDAWLIQKVYPTFIVEVTKDTLVHCVNEYLTPFFELEQVPNYSILNCISNTLDLLQVYYSSLNCDPWPLQLNDTRNLVFLCAIWGFGAHLSTDLRRRLQCHVLRVYRTSPKGLIDLASLLNRFSSLAHDTQATLFTIYFDVYDRTFAQTSFCQEISSVLQTNKLIVPTAQLSYASAITHLLYSATQSFRSIMVLGDSCVGKSVYAAIVHKLLPSAENWSNMDVFDRYQNLLYSLRRCAKAQTILLDDVDMYASSQENPLSSFELLRSVLVHRRIFNPSKDAWMSLDCSFCATATISSPLSTALSRCLRPFFVIQLSESSASEVQKICISKFAVVLGRPLSSTEVWFVDATIAAMLQARMQFKQPARLFCDQKITQILQVVLGAESNKEIVWLKQCAACFSDPLKSVEERANWRQNFLSTLPDHLATSFNELTLQQSTISSLSIPTAQAQDTKTNVEHIRTWLLSELAPSNWLIRLTPLKLHYLLNITAAVQSKCQVIIHCSDTDLIDSDSIMSIVSHILKLSTHVPLSGMQSQEDCRNYLRSLIIDTGIRQQHRLLCLAPIDFQSWPFLHEFIQNVFQCNHMNLAKDVVSQYISNGTPLEQWSAFNTFESLMKNVSEHLTMVIWQPTDLVHLTTHAKVNFYVLSFTGSESKYDIALGTIVQLSQQHEISYHDCEHLAAICAQVHDSVHPTCAFTFDHLLDNFKHVLERKDAQAKQVKPEFVVQLLLRLDHVKSKYHDASILHEKLKHLVSQKHTELEGLKGVLMSFESKTKENLDAKHRIHHNLHEIQDKLNGDKRELEKLNRKLSTDTLAMESIYWQPLLPGDYNSLLTRSAKVPLCRRILTILCTLFELDYGAAGQLLECPDLASRLLNFPMLYVQEELKLSTSDFSVLQELHPCIAAIARLLHFKWENAKLQNMCQRLESLIKDNSQQSSELESLEAALALQLAAITTQRTSARRKIDVMQQEIMALNQQLLQAKATIEQLQCLQTYIDILRTLLPSKYFIPIHSIHPKPEGTALFLSCMITYFGQMTATAQQELTTAWSKIFSRHKYPLPLTLGAVHDDIAAIFSTVEANICCRKMNKRLQHCIAIADWSKHCPLFYDDFGLAEEYVVSYLQRLQMAIPSIAFSVYSAREANIISCLEIAQQAQKVVVLTKVDVMDQHTFQTILPYLTSSRRPLFETATLGTPAMHRSGSLVLHIKDNGQLPQRGRSRSATIPALLNAIGTFQVYLVLDPQVKITALPMYMRSVLNPIHFDPPLKELGRKCHRMLRSLVLPTSDFCHQEQQIIKAQAHFRSSEMQALRELLEAVETNVDEAALIKLLIRLETNHQKCKSRIHTLQQQSPPTSSETLKDASILLSSMLQALHVVLPLQLNALPNFGEMVSLLERAAGEFKVSQVLPEESLEPVLARVYNALSRRLDAQTYKVFATAFAFSRDCETNCQVSRCIRFLGTTASEFDNIERENTTESHRRLSDMRVASAHINHIRRLRSSAALTGLPLTKNAHTASMPQMIESPVEDSVEIATAGFLSKEMCEQLGILETYFNELRGIGEHIKAHREEWCKAIRTSLHANAVLVPPDPWHNMHAFQLILLVKCICSRVLALHLDWYHQEKLSFLGLDQRVDIMSASVFLAMDSHDTIPDDLMEYGISIDRRIELLPCDPQGKSVISNHFSMEPAPKASIMVVLAAVDALYDIYDLLLKHERLDARKHGTIFFVYDKRWTLPHWIYQMGQHLHLPLYSLLSTTNEPAPVVVHESHLNHSIISKLSRQMPILHAQMRTWNRSFAIGWTNFHAFEYHNTEALAAFYQLNQGVIPEDRVVLEIHRALELGVYGADMRGSCDKQMLVDLLDSSLHPESSNAMDPLSSPTPQSQSSLHLSRHFQALYLSHCSQNIDTIKAMLLHFLRKYQELAVLPRVPKHGNAKPPELKALEGIFQRLKADSSSFYHFVAGMVEKLHHVSRHDLQDIQHHFVPSSWFNLPSYVSPIAMASWATYLERRCEHLQQLALPCATAIDFSLTQHPLELLVHVRLQYATALKKTLDSLHLVLELPSTRYSNIGGIAHDAHNHACGFVVDGLWLFHGQMQRLPSVLLVWMDKRTQDTRKAWLLPLYQVWTLEHFGQAARGDERVFKCICSHVHVYMEEDIPWQRMKHATILAPALATCTEG